MAYNENLGRQQPQWVVILEVNQLQIPLLRFHEENHGFQGESNPC